MTGLVFKIFGTLFLVSIFFAMNIKIVKMCLNTFDFWFKVWNLFIWSICVVLTSIATSDKNDLKCGIITLVLRQITSIVGCLYIFFVDTLPTQPKLKHIISIMGLIAMAIVWMPNTYLYYEFKLFGYVTISIKSIFLVHLSI